MMCATRKIHFICANKNEFQTFYYSLLDGWSFVLQMHKKRLRFSFIKINFNLKYQGVVSLVCCKCTCR